MLKKKIIFSCLILTLFLTNLPALFAQEQSRLPRMLFFYSQNCHACQKTKQEVMPAIEKEFFGKIIVDYLDIAEVNNYRVMLALKEKYKCSDPGWPAVFIEGTILVGYTPIKDGLRKIILDTLENKKVEKIDKLLGMDLVKHFKSFGILAIIVAGLLDGINPCAFTVIVFFVSFLAFQGYKKRELAAIGLVFISAVFLTYILVGLGIFRFLYSLRHFYILTKIVYYLIAGFCFILSIFALYDLWLFKKNGKTEGMVLQLPTIIKNRIHAIIGLYYRKEAQGKAEAGPRKHFVKLMISAFITGFLVSLLEAVCTGQLYVPTIAFVLKDSSLRLRAFSYLVLYNLMFIIPLFAVLLCALLGATSEGFSRFLRKHMVAVKLSMAIIFLGLGILMLIGA